jgi:hypothetical protein
MVVRGYRFDSEQWRAMGSAVTFLHPALEGQERLMLHEKHRERRKPDIPHRMVDLATTVIGKFLAHRSQTSQQSLEYCQALRKSFETTLA